MNEVICSDCIEHMAKMEPNSVDSIVTDPPYGLKFMGKDWDHGIPGVPFWTEALRVAKPGAHLLSFGGTRTFHRLTCAIEDAGWEIRDCLGWIYGSGFPKSHNLKGDHEGWGTALKPAWEPIILARKPMDGTVSANVQKWGTGAVNVDGCRVVVADRDEYEKNSAGNARAKRTSTPFIANANPNHISASAKGRWPANIIHDGSDDVLELFPQTASGWRNSDRPNGAKGSCNSFGANNVTGEHFGDSGSAARFFYCAKASRKEREMGLDGMPERPNGEYGLKISVDGREGRSQGERTDGKARNHHPTVKPVALMRYLCRLVTPPNGLILDPFCGSGSTLIAAKQEGFNYLGIDNNEEYCEIARKRVST